MRRMTYGILAVIALIGLVPVFGQGQIEVDCSPEGIARQQETFQQILTFDFAGNYDQSTANLFRLAAIYQQMAVECGYEPSEQEINALVQLTLSVTDLETVLAARAVGDDIEAIMAELETVTGDSFTGGLLYNGTEPGLDGSGLACLGCHNGETAPVTEGTWTRVDEIRLLEPQFEGYDHRRYLVESILHPNDYIVPDYVANLMPTNYGSRIDLQMLADLVTYLESQDQLLDE